MLRFDGARRRRPQINQQPIAGALHLSPLSAETGDIGFREEGEREGAMGVASVGCSPSRINPMGQGQKGQYESTPVYTWAEDPFSCTKWHESVYSRIVMAPFQIGEV